MLHYDAITDYFRLSDRDTLQDVADASFRFVIETPMRHRWADRHGVFELQVDSETGETVEFQLYYKEVQPEASPTNVKSYGLSQAALLDGIFKVEVLNTDVLMLPHERDRIRTLLLCMRRRAGVFTLPQQRAIITDVVRNIPNRGLDPVAVFRWMLYRVADGRIASEICDPAESYKCMSTDLPNFWNREPYMFPWICTIAGSSVLHRELKTAKWYPNDWDVYTPGECVEPYFVATLNDFFTTVELATERGFHSAKWYMCSGININLVMSDTMARTCDFDVVECGTRADHPFDVVKRPRHEPAALMRTRGVMSEKQLGRYNKYQKRFAACGMGLELVYTDRESVTSYDPADESWFH